MEYKVDLEKFICSLIKHSKEDDGWVGIAAIKKALKDQELEYGDDGGITKMNTRVTVKKEYEKPCIDFPRYGISWQIPEGVTVEVKDGMLNISYEYGTDANALIHNVDMALDDSGRKFKEGDWIVKDGNIYEVECNKLCYECRGEDGLRRIFLYHELENDRNAHPWTIKDAKDGDFLYIEEKEKNYECKWILKYKEIEDSKLISYFSMTNNSTFEDTGVWGDLVDIYAIRPARADEKKKILEKIDNSKDNEY